MHQIILNNEDYSINEEDLPSLIVYKEKSGGSHFSITLVVDLFKTGLKILFLTAFHMAKDNFLKQVGDDHSRISFVTNIDELKKAKDNQCIILESGNENLFTKATEELSDVDKRVILVKNIEAFSMKTFEHVLKLNKIILSGDIDNCVAKNEIIKKSWNSIVAFNKPETTLLIKIPILEKYNGYLSNKNKNGIIKIKTN